MAKARKAVKETSESTAKPLIELSEEEQWRLINQTGVLNKVTGADTALKAKAEKAEPEITTLGDEIFNASLLVIPMSFLLLMMEILIHRQFGKEPTLGSLADRMIPGVPIISLFVFYTTRYKETRRMQFFLFVLAIVAGVRLFWIVNRANWRVNMMQCPPLATAWVYAIVQLELGPAVLSLSVVGIWAYMAGMKLAF